MLLNKKIRTFSERGGCNLVPAVGLPKSRRTTRLTPPSRLVWTLTSHRRSGRPRSRCATRQRTVSVTNQAGAVRWRPYVRVCHPVQHCPFPRQYDSVWCGGAPDIIHVCTMREGTAVCALEPC